MSEDSTGSGKTTSSAEGGRAHTAGAFDVRTFIGALLGIYGVVLLLTGLFGTDDAQLAKADGVNANLWTGIGLMVVSGIFLTWARLRPVVVPEPEPESEVDEARDAENR